MDETDDFLKYMISFEWDKIGITKMCILIYLLFIFNISFLLRKVTKKNKNNKFIVTVKKGKNT